MMCCQTESPEVKRAVFLKACGVNKVDPQSETTPSVATRQNPACIRLKIPFRNSPVLIGCGTEIGTPSVYEEAGCRSDPFGD